MADPEPQKPSEVTIRAEAPPAPQAPEKEVHILPIQTVAAPVERAPDKGMEAVMAEIRGLHTKIDSALARPKEEPEEPEEEAVVAVTPPPPPPAPEEKPQDSPGPRKRTFLEKFLHAGCPDK